MGSNPLLKSKYSLKALTLMWVAIAPTRARMMCRTLTSPLVQTAVPTPALRRQAGG